MWSHIRGHGPPSLLSSCGIQGSDTTRDKSSRRPSFKSSEDPHPTPTDHWTAPCTLSCPLPSNIVILKWPATVLRWGSHESAWTGVSLSTSTHPARRRLEVVESAGCDSSRRPVTSSPRSCHQAWFKLIHRQSQYQKWVRDAEPTTEHSSFLGCTSRLLSSITCRSMLDPISVAWHLAVSETHDVKKSSA